MVDRQARLRGLSIIFLFAAAGITTKLFFVQIVNGDDYRALADRQYEKPSNQTFDRGTIYFTDRDGKKVSGATLQTGYLLVINPSRLEDPEVVYTALTAIIPLDYNNFMNRANRANDPYEEIASRLDEEQMIAITALNLPGVQLILQRWRFYPSGTLAAHVLGLMSSRGGNDDYAGQYGLEKYYDDVLKRQIPIGFSSFLGQIFLGLTHPQDTTSGAGDIVTTIEPTVERFLERELESIETKWRTTTVGGIIMDPQTGAIISMAARPTFDPGGKQSDIKHLSNPLIEGVNEMGSIMKPLTLSAGLDAKVITATTTYNDLGFVSLNNRRIENHDQRGRGVVSMQEVINQSLNTGAIFIMQKLGTKRFEKYFQDFGLLGEKTGIDLPGELSSLAGNLEDQREVEYATAAFGQGIAITPITITTALSSLANRGRLVRPFITKEINYETKLTVTTKPEIKRQVVSEAVASTTTAMLVEVVDKVLLGGRESLPHYRVAAKTGTAQMPKPGSGYYADRYLHSFFGYFPASNPRFSIFLYATEPQGAEYASATLAKPFFNLTKFLLNYYQIPPDR